MQTNTKKLPPQLVSLIHHIALNESGWWDKAVERFIISALWLSEKETPKSAQIKKLLYENFGVDISEPIVNKLLEDLIKKGEVIQLPDETFKISEPELKKFEEDLIKYEQIEKQTKDFYTELINKQCKFKETENSWNEFNDELLNPLVHELGAKTYELISGKKASVEQTTKFQDYLIKYPEHIQKSLREVILKFLDPQNRIVRDFILRKINAYFCLEAGNLSSDTIEKLSQQKSKKVEFKVFVDTNFLFSFLELHENPSNEAAQSLKKLVQDIQDRIDLKFYVSSDTIVEAKKVLNFHVDYLKRIRFTQNVLDGSKFLTFTGFAQKYFNEVQKSKVPISVEKFFSPYVDNLISTIRPKGIEFYNENMGKYKLDQRVIDDVNDSLKYEEKTFKKEAKTYEQLLHDIILWYYIFDKRNAIVESPIDAKYWVATVDFRYLGFDAYKLRNNQKMCVPICIHPASLIQIFQFWIPRTPQFEEAIMNNIRTPFLSYDFDHESENLTIKILQALSRYESLEDLPSETITSVLINEVLRGKISKTKDITEQINLIRDVILQENVKVSEKLELEKQLREKLTGELEDKGQIIQELRNELVKAKSESQAVEIKQKDLQDRIEKLEKSKEKEKAYIQEMSKYNQSLQDYVDNSWNTYYKQNNRAMWYFILALLIGGIVIWASLDVIENTTSKIIIPIIFWCLTLLFSFFSREKIKISFGLNLSRKKNELNKKKEYSRIFEKENKKPHLEQ